MTSISEYLASRPRDPEAQKAWLAGLADVAKRRARELKLPEGSTASGPSDDERDVLAGVTPLFARASLNDFPQISADLTRLYIRLTSPPEDARYPGLLLAGEPGRGKTHLGCAFVRAFIRQKRRAFFSTARQLQRSIWASYTDGGDEKTAMAAYTRPDLLVVDDLGHEGRAGDASLSLLLDVLDERANHRRPTVVTTNLTGDEVATRFDDAMYSRISAYDRLVLDGADRRQSCRGS
jgi:hypothetical protein